MYICSPLLLENNVIFYKKNASRDYIKAFQF